MSALPSRGVLVTGSSRGVGAAAARAFASRGDRVVVHYLGNADAAREVRAGLAGDGHAVVQADLADPAAVERLARESVEALGRVDVLVNNAGVIDTEVPLLDSDPEEWWRTVEVNVRGAYLMTWADGRALRERTGGTDGLRVVNLNSGSGLRAGRVATAYNLSKTALARLTGSTHHSGIPCLDLMPGVVRTDMTESMRAHVGRTEWTDPHDVTALVLAFGAGELDAWSGRVVRAGVDTPESLRTRGAQALADDARMLTLESWGGDDPLA